MSERLEWIVVEAERALYVDHGRTVVLCDRLPAPVTLVLQVRRVAHSPETTQERTESA